MYSQPMAHPYSQPVGPKPNNYLAWAIISTVLCCLPFGIVAIVYASKVDPAWSSGDRLGAERASRMAKNWTIAAVVPGVLIMLLYIGLMLFGVAASGPSLS